jgi:WD40 repeat protein
MPATILFLSANPSDTRPLGVDDEAREIQRIFRRDARFEVKLAPAARVDDFQTWLLERPRPRVVHFSGHGARGGAAGTRGAIARPVAPAAAGALLVLDDEGLAVSVSPAALARLFELLGGVCCAVLNACFSEAQAEALVAHVDYVIGTTGEIDDRASIAFSKAFYEAIGAGEALKTAFELGRNAIVRNGLGHAGIVRDFYRQGVKPEEIRVAEVREERAPFCVPFFQNPGFVGRAEDLAALHALLQEEKAAGVRPAALTGMGGIGKTQLAVEYAYRHRDDYPGGVYWVNAAQDVQAEMAELAKVVGLFEDGAPDAERQQRRLLAFVRFLDERPEALVILDNVEDPRSLRTKAFGFVPAQLRCRLLFTTRRRDGSGAFATVPVGALAEEEALALLAGSARRVWEGEELTAAREMCLVLGGLPLALALAGSFLWKNPEVAVEEYRERLLVEGALAAADAPELVDEDLPTRHAASVEATLRVDWEALAKLPGGGQAERRVLQAAALLGEAAEVPAARLALLTGLAEKAEKKGYPAPLGAALRRLGELSLVEALGEKAIRLHPLVREFAERRIEGRDEFAAECAGNLGEALWEMGRLNDEAAARGVDAVLEDLRAGVRLSRDGEAGWIERLVRPLDREAHCLRKWKPLETPEFLLQQVRNRCFEMGEEDGRGLAEAALAERGLGHLRERVRSGRESEALVRTLEGHTERLTGVAVTADGRWAVSASHDRTLKVWDLGSGQLVRTLEGHTSLVSGVAVTADGRWAVSASWDKTVKVWDLGSGQLVRTLEGHTERVAGVAVTADSRWAVSASHDDTLKVWDLGSGQLTRTREGHTDSVTGVAVTVDGRWAVSASSDNTLKVWDLGSGQLVRTLEGHTRPVTGVAVTADSRWAVSASSDNTLKVWDLGSGQLVRTLEGHANSVTGVAVTADGRWAASASYDRTLKVWDLGNGQLVRTLEGHANLVTGVAVTADGRWAVSASYDDTLKVWDLGSGQLVRTLEGHMNVVSGVAVTADSRWAVSASHDRTLKVWDLGSGQLVRTLEGHTERVSGVAVTADGRWAVSASHDNTLRVWYLTAGLTATMLETHAPLLCCAVASDRLILAGDEAGALHLLDWHPGAPASPALLSPATAPRRPSPPQTPAPDPPRDPR